MTLKAWFERVLWMEVRDPFPQNLWCKYNCPFPTHVHTETVGNKFVEKISIYDFW